MSFVFRKYLIISKTEFFKRGIPNSRDASPRIQSFADFGKDMYLKRPASNANGEYNKLIIIIQYKKGSVDAF